MGGSLFHPKIKHLQVLGLCILTQDFKYFKKNPQFESWVYCLTRGTWTYGLSTHINEVGIQRDENVSLNQEEQMQTTKPNKYTPYMATLHKILLDLGSGT